MQVLSLFLAVLQERHAAADVEEDVIELLLNRCATQMNNVTSEFQCAALVDAVKAEAGQLRIPAANAKSSAKDGAKAVEPESEQQCTDRHSDAPH